MGIVYKAQDLKLKRFVAIKILPSELASDEKAKKRFIQEAQAAAVLSHPNICTIYEVICLRFLCLTVRGMQRISRRRELKSDSMTT